MGGVSDHLSLEAAGATVIPFGAGESQLLIRTILDLKVRVIHCTPSYPAALERTIAEHFPGLAPRDLGLTLGLFGGEAGLDDPSFRGASGERLGLYRAQRQLRRLRRVQQFREPVLGQQRPALPGRGRAVPGADRARERRSGSVAGGRERRAGADAPEAGGAAAGALPHQRRDRHHGHRHVHLRAQGDPLPRSRPQRRHGGGTRG